MKYWTILIILGDSGKITEIELQTLQHKTQRHIRLRELLLEHSQDATLIVM